MSADKQQILETITAVSRLITLAFKPKGTKISIRNHNIVLCEPKTDNSYYKLAKIPQSLERYWNGDSRDDIYILNHVICNFIEWYIIPYKNKKDEHELYKGLINMARYLVVGLKELQNTYKIGTAVGTLQYYIIALSAVIDDRFYPEMLYNPATFYKKNYHDDEQNDEISVIYSTIFDVDKFKNFWTREELKSLCYQFEKCFRYQNEPDTIIFKDTEQQDDDSIQSIYGLETNNDGDNFVDDTKTSNDSPSESKENRAVSLPLPIGYGIPLKNVASSDINFNILDTDVPNVTTSSPNVSSNINLGMYSEHLPHQPNMNKRRESRIRSNVNSNPSHNRSWPVARSLTNVVVRGHLTGISDILSMMDKRFTAMLSQSVKGTN
jgi:hypothetical protein